MESINKTQEQEEIEALRETIEFARNYRGHEARPCPLCIYENGVFKGCCEPHKQLAEMEREKLNWQSATTHWRKVFGELFPLQSVCCPESLANCVQHLESKLSQQAETVANVKRILKQFNHAEDDTLETIAEVAVSAYGHLEHRSESAEAQLSHSEIERLKREVAGRDALIERMLARQDDVLNKLKQINEQIKSLSSSPQNGE
jgi:uncharacterized coiled-coil protein SlyX